jgi:hypothetical protein
VFLVKKPSKKIGKADEYKDAEEKVKKIENEKNEK